jgi:hypothetical protein
MITNQNPVTFRLHFQNGFLRLYLPKQPHKFSLVDLLELGFVFVDEFYREKIY